MVGRDGVELVSCVLEGVEAPDFGTVDDVARFTLVARRLGGTIRVDELSPALELLLELAGLGRDALGVEMKGQPELREEALGVEEGEEVAQGRDLPA